MPGRCRSATRGHKSSPAPVRRRSATRAFTRKSRDGAAQHYHRKKNCDGAHRPADTLRFVNVTSMSLEPFVRGLNQLPLETTRTLMELNYVRQSRQIALRRLRHEVRRNAATGMQSPRRLNCLSGLILKSGVLRVSRLLLQTGMPRSQRSATAVTSERFLPVASILRAGQVSHGFHCL